MEQFLAKPPDSGYQALAMRRTFASIGAFLVGTVGWAVGSWIDMEVAMVLSCVGSGFGIYWGNKLFDHWLG